MLPAPNSEALSLADVMRSCLASIAGRPNRLGLPPVHKAVVLLVDGLGADSLKARAGHARTLVSAMTGNAVIESGFPTTTAAAIATLTTGTRPGHHGIVGYSAFDAAHKRVVNQLSGWDAQMNPLTWQPESTLFEAAVADGFDAVVIGPERYRETGFSKAVLRGARYEAAATIAGRMGRAAELLQQGTQHSLIYVYVPELDQAGHAHGQESPTWISALEATDAEVRHFERALGPRHGLIVTADHGMLDIPSYSHVLFDQDKSLIDGVQFVAGEPRCLQLHFAADASVSQRSRVLEAWHESESERSWVATRHEAIAANWFGPVRPDVESRIGDILVAARKGIAYYDSRAGTSAQAMIGQHGSWSPAEVRVPLLRFGAYAT
jgi:hypothetical protein